MQHFFLLFSFLSRTISPGGKDIPSNNPQPHLPLRSQLSNFSSMFSHDTRVTGAWIANKDFDIRVSRDDLAECLMEDRERKGPAVCLWKA